MEPGRGPGRKVPPYKQGSVSLSTQESRAQTTLDDELAGNVCQPVVVGATVPIQQLQRNSRTHTSLPWIQTRSATRTSQKTCVLGRAVQVNPIKQTRKPYGTISLKQKYCKLLSNFAFTFNLRRYNLGAVDAVRSGVL